ncbi:MAG: rRNA biogenesis protein Nop56/Nop58 [Candidatus Hecatellales archaeon B24]|nr:MAG: rRNA biogenesis protein Nop56/Nop58 [Candidatus Hecatellales archaeon B24]
MAKAYLVETAFGLLALNDKGEIMDKAFFPKKPEKAASLLLKIESGEVTSEVKRLVEKLKASGFTHLVFENEKLAAAVKDRLKVEVEVESPSRAGEAVRSNLAETAVEIGYVGKPEQFYDRLREISTWVSRLRVREAAARKDKVVVQAVSAVDELDKALNVMAGRIREWFGLHFPELNRLVEAHETYARLVASLGGKENFTVEKLVEAGVPKGKAKAVEEAARTSLGAPMDREDLESLQSLCRLCLEGFKMRKTLAERVDKILDEIAPNLKALAGPTISARLISLAGGLEELARLPSSTIQVLGAEKALFRALRTGARPPKHGIIFQHPLLHQAPRWQRGKIARAVAGKISIAAKVDVFSGNFVGDRLKADLERRVREIKEKYRRPSKPERKAVGRKRKRKRRR